MTHVLEGSFRQKDVVRVLFRAEKPLIAIIAPIILQIPALGPHVVIIAVNIAIRVTAIRALTAPVLVLLLPGFSGPTKTHARRVSKLSGMTLARLSLR
jgi:hypothetical protein